MIYYLLDNIYIFNWPQKCLVNIWIRIQAREVILASRIRIRNSGFTDPRFRIQKTVKSVGSTKTA